MDFREGFRALQQECWEIAEIKGWHGVPVADASGPNISRLVELLCLTHSELSEALEDIREGHSPEIVRFVDCPLTPGFQKPEGFVAELADAIVRICDIAEGLNVDLATVLRQKLDYNKTRPYRHGGKVL